MNLLELSTLKVGQKGSICLIDGDKALRSRLAALGFRKGVVITVSHSALMGDPRSYTIGNAHISLRKNEAQHIKIQLDDAE